MYVKAWRNQWLQMRHRQITHPFYKMELQTNTVKDTTAMELVNSGVDLIYIRDLLGHASVKTTEIYARADAKLKREAIEAASKETLL